VPVIYPSLMQLPIHPVCAGIILGVLIFMAGCTGTPPVMNNSGNLSPDNSSFSQIPVIIPSNGSVIVFNESDNGKTYAIFQDTEFAVNLTETLALGAQWHASFSPGLEPLGDQYYANPEMPRFDIQGTHVWHIRAAGTGEQSFQAIFYRFDDSDNVQQRYTLSFRVQPESG